MTCLGNKSFMGLNASLTVRKVAPSYWNDAFSLTWFKLCETVWNMWT
jgi:hypothetical protein